MRRLALIALIWGWSFLFIKVAVQGMTPTAVAGARIALGAIAMLTVVRAQRIVLPRDPKTWWHFLVMGVVFNAIPFTLLAWGEQRITSALTAVLNATTPLFAALLTAVLLGERLRRPQLLGVVLGFAGVAVAAGAGASDLAGSSLTGSLAVVIAALCYGFGFVYARRNLSATPPLVAATGQLVTGTVVIAPLAIGTSITNGIELTPHRLLAVGLLGVLGTGLAHLLNYRSIAEVGPTRASVVTQLVPVVAVAVGVAFLDEPFHVRLVVGAALTLFGIGLLHERFRRFRAVPVAI
ncbi:MAG TPA: DMT family transporter [Acidimicrobiales bacterium]|nr:DMT family transporter [Acidimicrobiales bacterium]